MFPRAGLLNKAQSLGTISVARVARVEHPKKGFQSHHTFLMSSSDCDVVMQF